MRLAKSEKRKVSFIFRLVERVSIRLTSGRLNGSLLLSLFLGLLLGLFQFGSHLLADAREAGLG